MKNDWNDLTDEQLQQIGEVRQSLILKQNGTVDQCKQNCVNILQNDPILKGCIRYDQMACKPVIIGNIGYDRDDGAEIDDDDEAYCFLYFEKFYDIRNEKNILSAMKIIAKQNAFHPLKDHLESLVWDGQPRIRYMLHRYLGADTSDLTYECLKTFMLGAIKRVYYPGCKFEIMLCLVGEQGLGKSSLFRFMALKDEWFSDDLKKLDDENVYRKLQGHWIIEMAEMLGTASAKSVEETKAFLSRQKETYKVPYERHAKDRPRQCVFVGTSNKIRFLPLDRTGNRRFYPIETDWNKAEKHVLDDEQETRAYMDQLWAEAMEIYRSGEWSLKLSDDMEHQLSLYRMKFMAEDTAAGKIQEWLDGCRHDYVCTMMIYAECYKMLGDPDRKTINEINDIMNNSIEGWKPGPNHRFGIPYGNQRSWMREDPTESDLAAEGFVPMTPEQLAFELPSEWRE